MKSILKIINWMNEIKQGILSAEMIKFAIISIFVMEVIFIVVTIFVKEYLYKKVIKDNNISLEDIEKITKRNVNRPQEIVQLILEMIICNTCIIGLIFVYYCLSITVPFFDKYAGIIMIILIIIELFINNLLDEKLNQNMLNKDEKGKMRIMSSLCVMVILLISRFYYKISDYDNIIILYVGLTLSRFFFFDTTFKNMFRSIKDARTCIAVALVSLLIIIVFAIIGIYCNVTMTDNMILNLFLIHLGLVIYVIPISKSIDL